MHLIFGMNIDELVETMTGIGMIISAGSWLFKRIALDPLREDIQILSQQLGQQLKAHEQTLSAINGRLKDHDHELNSHSVRLTRLEDRTGIKEDDNKHED